MRLSAASVGAGSALAHNRDMDHADVFTAALKVFGSAEAAKAWLQEPALALDGRRPAEVLAEPGGAAVVLALLGRLERGVYT